MKPKRFHRYSPKSAEIRLDRIEEMLDHLAWRLWRERIDARPAGSIAFAPEAK